jgi:sigma-E factor negative regulatory protein RseC
MIEETAQVLRSDGEYAWVETQRRSSCGSCAAKQGCGTGALSQVLGAKTQQMKVRNPVAAKPGDEVVLGIEEGALIRGSLAVYLLPLVTMLMAGLLGQWLAPQWLLDSETLGMVFAIAGLFGGLLWLRGFNRRAGGDPRYMAEILRINPVVIRFDGNSHP